MVMHREMNVDLKNRLRVRRAVMDVMVCPYGNVNDIVRSVNARMCLLGLRLPENAHARDVADCVEAWPYNIRRDVSVFMVWYYYLTLHAMSDATTMKYCDMV